MQLKGPNGPVYVRPEDIVGLTGMYEYLGVKGLIVRDLHVRGASTTIQIVDTPDNTAAVLDAMQERRVNT